MRGGVRAVPVAVLMLVLLLACVWFFSHLPAKQRILFLVSGLLYVGRAMDPEMVNGLVASISCEQKGPGGS